MRSYVCWLVGLLACLCKCVRQNTRTYRTNRFVLFAILSKNHVFIFANEINVSAAQ